MKYSLFTSILILVLLACGSDNDNMPNADVTDDPQNTDPSFEAFEIDQVVNEITGGYQELLDRGSMSVGLIKLKSEETSSRSQTTLDEVFFIYSGQGILTVDGNELEVKEGDAIVVMGNLDSNLSTSDSITAVLISLKENGFVRTNFKRYSRDQTSRLKDGNSNTWNPFMQEPNVSFGLYSLPAIRGGDGTLFHDWDELNIITAGNSRFTMGGQSVNVKPGTIVFVKEGTGHFFSQIGEDIDIMILWEQ